MSDIVVRDLGNEKNYQYGFYCWQSNNEFFNTQTNTSISLSDSVGGCGMQQMYNWLNYKDNDDIGDVLKFLLSNLHYGTSLLICQVGEDHWDSNFVACLENNGFEITKEYANNYHDKENSQRLYTKIIE